MISRRALDARILAPEHSRAAPSTSKRKLHHSCPAPAPAASRSRRSRSSAPPAGRASCAWSARNASAETWYSAKGEFSSAAASGLRGRQPSAGPRRTAELSVASIRLILGRIDGARRVLEARRQASRRNRSRTRASKSGKKGRHPRGDRRPRVARADAAAVGPRRGALGAEDGGGDGPARRLEGPRRRGLGHEHALEERGLACAGAGARRRARSGGSVRASRALRGTLVRARRGALGRVARASRAGPRAASARSRRRPRPRPTAAGAPAAAPRRPRGRWRGPAARTC